MQLAYYNSKFRSLEVKQSCLTSKYWLIAESNSTLHGNPSAQRFYFRSSRHSTGSNSGATKKNLYSLVERDKLSRQVLGYVFY